MFSNAPNGPTTKMAAKMASMANATMNTTTNGTNATRVAGGGSTCARGSMSPNELAVIARDAFPGDGSMPDFALCMVFPMMIGGIGRVASNMVFPRLSDTYGRKPFLVLNFFFGSIIAVASFYVAVDLRSFWGFMVLKGLSGVFGGSGTCK